VRWGVAGNIVLAWLMTLPCAAVVGAGMEVLTRLPGGAALVFALTVAIAAVAFVGRSWQSRKLALA
jgi:PiT family inorganic phosphate transporter